MKLKIHERVYFSYYLSFRETYLECRGEGTEEDPVIIEPSEDLPKDFTIKNSNLSININNCINAQIAFEKCKNITLEGCTISLCKLHKCSDMVLKSGTISRLLTVYSSYGITLEELTINKLHFYHSDSSLIKKCKIDYIDYKYSKDNRFQGNIFPEKLLAKWRRQNQKKKKSKTKN